MPIDRVRSSAATGHAPESVSLPKCPSFRKETPFTVLWLAVIFICEIVSRPLILLLFFSKLVTFSVHDVNNEMFSERSECNKTIIIFLVL